MFSSRSFIVSGLTFRSLTHFEFILCVVLQSVLSSFFYRWLTSFPSTTCFVFFPLYILTSFVKDKVSIGVWMYLWAILFRWSIFLSLCLYYTAWWLWLCSVVWSQVGWFLQFHSSKKKIQILKTFYSAKPYNFFGVQLHHGLSKKETSYLWEPVHL